MQFGDVLPAFFFVTRPVPPLTRYAAILDVLARIAHLEVSAALATLGGTMRHRIWVVHGILCIRYVSENVKGEAGRRWRVEVVQKSATAPLCAAG